jgi:integrase
VKCKASPQKESPKVIPESKVKSGLDNYLLNKEDFVDLKYRVEKIKTINLRVMNPEVLDSIFDLSKFKIFNKTPYFLFTPTRKTGVYTAKEGNKVKFFSKQFAEYLNELNLGMEHTIYSMRHTFAIDLYQNFIRKGKTDREVILTMLPITRHKSEAGLRNYLRNIGATVAKDYSDAYSLDF